MGNGYVRKFRPTYLFREPLFVVEFGLETSELLGRLCPLLGLPGLFLPRPLFMIESASVTFAMELDMLVLGHAAGGLSRRKRNGLIS